MSLRLNKNQTLPQNNNTTKDKQMGYQWCSHPYREFINSGITTHILVRKSTGREEKLLSEIMGEVTGIQCDSDLYLNMTKTFLYISRKQIKI